MPSQPTNPIQPNPGVPLESSPAAYQDIQEGIVTLLEAARTSAARSVNALMTASYWEIVCLLSLRDPAASSFYEAETLRCGWSVRQLKRQVDSLFYERTALSRNKAGMLEEGSLARPGDTITPVEALRDPFVLEFLDLKDDYSESELEEALIRHLADFGQSDRRNVSISAQSRLSGNGGREARTWAA